MSDGVRLERGDWALIAIVALVFALVVLDSIGPGTTPAATPGTGSAAAHEPPAPEPPAAQQDAATRPQVTGASGDPAARGEGAPHPATEAADLAEARGDDDASVPPLDAPTTPVPPDPISPLTRVAEALPPAPRLPVDQLPAPPPPVAEAAAPTVRGLCSALDVPANAYGTLVNAAAIFAPVPGTVDLANAIWAYHAPLYDLCLLAYDSPSTP